jgi:hypothetical protein
MNATQTQDNVVDHVTTRNRIAAGVAETRGGSAVGGAHTRLSVYIRFAIIIVPSKSDIVLCSM